MTADLSGQFSWQRNSASHRFHAIPSACLFRKVLAVHESQREIAFFLYFHVLSLIPL